jgi:hypothetical protein
MSHIIPYIKKRINRGIIHRTKILLLAILLLLVTSMTLLILVQVTFAQSERPAQARRAAAVSGGAFIP